MSSEIKTCKDAETVMNYYGSKRIVGDLLTGTMAVAVTADR